MTPDPIRAALDRLDTIPADVVPQPAGRPSRAAVTDLLALDGHAITMTTSTVVEDVDGLPAGVETSTTTATLDVDLAQLGWTDAEWNNPNITE